MSYKSDFDAFVGGICGTFKGIKIGKDACIQKNIQNLISITEHDRITTMSWDHDKEKEILIACGGKEIRSVKVYDTESSTFTCLFHCDDGKGDINGISRYDGAILTAVESGLVKLWKFSQSDQIVINAGENLERMRHSYFHKNIIATGGREHPLQLFDLNQKTRIFIEKNLPHDSLELRVPLWISDITFLPGTHKIATASRYGNIRLYDTSAQRRPVINVEIKDEALSCLTPTSKEMQVIVGSGKGRMNLIDLRKPGKVLNTYKGSVGAVTAVACSKTGPYVVSVGLDRYLRVHHIETKQMVKDIYLKSRLTSLLLRSEFSLDVACDEDNVNSCKKNVSSNNNISENDHTKDTLSKPEVGSDAEYDALFDKMEVIGSKVDNPKLHAQKRKASENQTESKSAKPQKKKKKRSKKNKSAAQAVKHVTETEKVKST